MKKLLVFLVILLLAGAAAYAQTVVFEQSFSSSTMLPKSHGDWEIMGGRLYQSDVDERLAKINVEARQSGEMQYEFTVRYEGGGFTDLMGGFGIQIFVDKAWEGKSWGNGNSYLLWLNYDPMPTYGPKGFSAQVYKSMSETKMALIGVEDPTLAGFGYRFSLGGAPGRGNFVSLRTNSLALSFDDLTITKLK